MRHGLVRPHGFIRISGRLARHGLHRPRRQKHVLFFARRLAQRIFIFNLCDVCVLRAVILIPDQLYIVILLAKRKTQRQRTQTQNRTGFLRLPAPQTRPGLHFQAHQNHDICRRDSQQHVEMHSRRNTCAE